MEENQILNEFFKQLLKEKDEKKIAEVLNEEEDLEKALEKILGYKDNGDKDD